MNNADKDLAVVVFTNRKDFFLTKLCISSIRFYYPDIEIFLVKDQLNGNFSTRRLRKAFNVKLLQLEKKYFGWSAAKVHFLLDKHIPMKRYLCLDSDIIFVGHVIDMIRQTKGDFIFNPHYIDEPLSDEILGIYLDPEKVKNYYPDYEYPGYFFNAGQTVVTPRMLTKELLTSCFDPDVYPYYKNRETFTLVDQAVLNAVMPVIRKRNGVQVTALTYMRLSVQFFADEADNNFDLYSDGKAQPYLVHYCGDVRLPAVEKMKGSNVLQAFRNHYYSRLSAAGRLLDKWQDSIAAVQQFTKILYTGNRLYIEAINRLSKNKG